LKLRGVKGKFYYTEILNTAAEIASIGALIKAKAGDNSRRRLPSEMPTFKGVVDLAIRRGADALVESVRGSAEHRQAAQSVTPAAMWLPADKSKSQ